MYDYVEIVTNGIHNRGHVYKINGDNLHLDFYNKESVDSFHSVFMHSSLLEEFVKETGSLKGYNGSVFSSYLYWDMDDEEDLDKVRNDTVTLVERIMKLGRNFRVYYSGNKGFHVFMSCPELTKYSAGYNNFNIIVKNACKRIAKGLETFDSRIYDLTRIIRTPNSKHSSTGRYKVEITYDQLIGLTIDEILEVSENQVYSEKFVHNTEDSSYLIKLLNESDVDEEEKRSVYGADELLSGIAYGFSRGSRNSGLASVAGLLHSRNIDDTFVEAIIQAINTNGGDPLPESEVSSIARSICRYSVEEKYKEVEDSGIITMEEAGKKWEENIKRSGNFSLGSRYSLLNDVMNITLSGDLIGVISNSGVGKSTLTLDFGNEFAKIRNGLNLFVSLEMAAHACFFRAATMSYPANVDGEVSSREVAYQLLNDDDIRKSIYKDWDRTLIVDKGSIPISIIEEYGYKAKQKYENLVSVTIDYTQYIDGASEIDKSLFISREIKNVMKRLDVVGFAAMQCNKSLPDSYTEIQDTHIEGVKAWKQAVDYLIAVWKSRDNNKRLHGKFLKTRWEKDDTKFDLVREGLKYSTDTYIPDRNMGGGL